MLLQIWVFSCHEIYAAAGEILSVVQSDLEPWWNFDAGDGVVCDVPDRDVPVAPWKEEVAVALEIGVLPHGADGIPGCSRWKVDGPVGHGVRRLVESRLEPAGLAVAVGDEPLAVAVGRAGTGTVVS